MKQGSHVKRHCIQLTDSERWDYRAEETSTLYSDHRYILHYTVAENNSIFAQTCTHISKRTITSDNSAQTAAFRISLTHYYILYDMDLSTDI